MMVLADDLRQSVLYAAVQGRLTEQIATDTPIDEYYEALQIQKRDYDTKRKARKGQSLDEIGDDEIPFDIPKSWMYVRLIDIVKSISAGGDKPKNFSKVKTSQYQVEVISNGETNNGIFGYTDISVVTERSLTISGRGTIGFSVIRDKPYVPIVRVLVVLPLDGTNLEYIQLALKALIEYGSGTAVKQLTVPMISPKVIPLPPIEEQQRIVERVKELMQQIDEYAKIEQKLISLKDSFPGDLRSSILQAAMQGKLTEQNMDSEKSPMDCIMDDKNDLLKKHLIKKDKRLFINDEIEEFPYDIPDNWQWTFLGNILQKLTDGTHRTPKYSDAGVKFISVKDMSSGKICFENTKYITVEEHKELYKRCDPKWGDMLLSKVGTTGVPAFVDTDEEFSLFVSVALLRFNHEYILPRFLYYLIYSPLVQWQATENTKGVGNQNWVLDKMARTIIVLPPVEEQKRIVERLDAILPMCEGL